MTESSPTEFTPPPNRKPLTLAIASVILFLIFFTIGNGPTSLIVSGVAGLIAVILAILELRAGRKQGIQIAALIIGLIGFLLSAGIGIFALIFIGAIPL